MTITAIVKATTQERCWRCGVLLTMVYLERGIVETKCYNCNEYGHFARDCRNPRSERRDRGPGGYRDGYRDSYRDSHRNRSPSPRSRRRSPSPV